jgi:hypothetical protein
LLALDSTTPVKTMVSSDLGGAVGTGDWFPMARKKSLLRAKFTRLSGLPQEILRVACRAAKASRLKAKFA